MLRGYLSEAIELCHFDINLMEWSLMPVKALFRIEKEPIGTGGFQKAFKATTSERELSDTLWVIKKYLSEAEQIIKANQSNTGATHKESGTDAHVGKKLCEKT